eukprot:gene26420-32412_t
MTQSWILFALLALLPALSYAHTTDVCWVWSAGGQGITFFIATWHQPNDRCNLRVNHNGNDLDCPMTISNTMGYTGYYEGEQIPAGDLPAELICRGFCRNSGQGANRFSWYTFYVSVPCGSGRWSINAPRHFVFDPTMDPYHACTIGGVTWTNPGGLHMSGDAETELRLGPRFIYTLTPSVDIIVKLIKDENCDDHYVIVSTSPDPGAFRWNSSIGQHFFRGLERQSGVPVERRDQHPLMLVGDIHQPPVQHRSLGLPPLLPVRRRRSDSCSAPTLDTPRPAIAAQTSALLAPPCISE